MIEKMDLMALKIVNKNGIVSNGEFNALGLATRHYNTEDKVLGYLENLDYKESILANKQITAIVTTPDIAKEISCDFKGGIYTCAQPRNSFFEIHNYLKQETDFYYTSHKNQIAETAYIHPTAVIEEENVVIGENCNIGAYTVIKENSYIGDNVNIREGCTIGTPAFYYYGEDDDKKLVESAGSVIIEDNVELHSGVSIEKGVFGSATRIGRNTKIDNLTLVGHDSSIGRNCVIAAGTTLAGYVTLKDSVFLGVAVAIAPLVTVGEHCTVSIGAAVTKDTQDNVQVSGNFAIEHSQFIKNLKSSIEL